MIEENKYYLEQINILKDLLDQMSDICGFEDFLKQSVLQDLDLYLDKYHEYISSHLQKYYLENKDDYVQSEYNNIGNINNERGINIEEVAKINNAKTKTNEEFSYGKSDSICTK